MRHADEPELTDHDRRAIEEIRRQLDRQFGPPWPEARGNTEIARTDHDPPAASAQPSPSAAAGVGGWRWAQESSRWQPRSLERWCHLPT